MRFFQLVLRQAILIHALYVTDRLTTDPTDHKFRHEFELILIEKPFYGRTPSGSVC